MASFIWPSWPKYRQNQPVLVSFYLTELTKIPLESTGIDVILSGWTDRNATEIYRFWPAPAPIGSGFA